MPVTHIVDAPRDGIDSIWGIAKHYGVSFEETKRLNPSFASRRPPFYLNNCDAVTVPDPPAGAPTPAKPTQLTAKCPCGVYKLSTPFLIAQATDSYLTPVTGNIHSIVEAPKTLASDKTTLTRSVEVCHQESL